MKFIQINALLATATIMMGTAPSNVAATVPETSNVDHDVAAADATSTVTLLGGSSNNDGKLAKDDADPHPSNTINRLLRGTNVSNMNDPQPNDYNNKNDDDENDNRQNRELYVYYWGLRFKNVAVQKCMDIPWPHPGDGTNLHTWECHNLANQRFSTTGNTNQSGWFFTYPSDHGGFTGSTSHMYCLDPEGPSTDPGTPIQTWSCIAGYSYHEWIWSSPSDNSFARGQIKLANTNMCATATGAYNGASITIQPCTANNNYQLWDRY